MRNMDIPSIEDFLTAPDWCDAIVLAANVAENYAIPTGAKYVTFSGNGDFYVSYLADIDDLVVNGAMASDTAWTKGTGWTIATGVASSDGSQSAESLLSQTAATLVEGRAYLTSFTATRSAGTVALRVGGTTGTSRSTAATFSQVLIAAAGTTIEVAADADFIGTVDAVSVIPVAIVPAADNITGQASEMNPAMRWLPPDITHLSLITAATAAVVTMSFWKERR